MTTTIDHYATCASWQTGWTADCSCRPAWRIRSSKGRYRWQILRWTDSGYLRIMDASTFEKAMALIDGFIERESAAVRSDVA